MSDQTAGMAPHRIERVPRVEFRLYFALILLLALPLCMLGWIGALMRQGAWPERGPFARACAEARVITPLIFSA